MAMKIAVDLEKDTSKAVVELFAALSRRLPTGMHNDV